MNILMMAINDPAGTGVQMCKALNRHTAHRARIATLETRYGHEWEKDLHLPDLSPEGLGELGRLLEQSDVFHFHMTADENLQLGPYPVRDFMKGKKIVHHHHGHHDFRSDPDAFRKKYARLGRRNLLVSTPDLLKLLPEASWQPNLVPIDEFLFTPNDDKPEEPFRLAHSPTRKDLKNTDDLLAVVAEERERGLEIELDMIECAPNRECLKRKRRCHAMFDHMQGYYGVTSLEGLSQGLAVIAGLDDWNIERISEFAGTDDLPWVMARNREELRERIRELAADPVWCASLGRKGREFMERCWSDGRLARKLSEFYAGLS